MQEEKDRPAGRCFYCNELMGNEFHIVVLPGGAIIDAHKRCHTKAQAEKSNIRIIIK